jgi:hypothetical protein
LLVNQRGGKGELPRLPKRELSWKEKEETWNEIFDTWVPLCLCRKWLPGRKGAAELDPGAPASAKEGWLGRFKFVKEEKDLQP